MKRSVTISLSVLAVVVLAVAAGVVWFLRDDAPAEADLSATASSLRENPTTSSTTSGQDAGAGAAPTGESEIDGTWTVDTETGDFDYESATGTFAGIRIEEVLANFGSTTAVARTGEVSGTLVIDAGTVTSAEVTVDMTTLTSNDGRRDNRMHQAIESAQFPTASFSLTEPIPLPAEALQGSPIKVTGMGLLEVHGVGREVSVEIEAQLVEGVIVMTATTPIRFADHDVEVPESQLVLSVEDHGILEMQLLWVRD